MFAGLAPLFWHFSGTTLFIAAALAFAYFSPVFKKTALWVALGGALAFVSYTMGVQDEKHHWTVQEQRTSDIGSKAREDAVNSVQHPSDGSRRLRNDPDCRDCESQ